MQDGNVKNDKNPWSPEASRSWNHTPCRRINRKSIGIALRAEGREITKFHPEVFTVDNACVVGTQSESELESEHNQNS